MGTEIWLTGHLFVCPTSLGSALSEFMISHRSDKHSRFREHHMILAFLLLCQHSFDPQRLWLHLCDPHLSLSFTLYSSATLTFSSLPCFLPPSLTSLSNICLTTRPSFFFFFFNKTSSNTGDRSSSDRELMCVCVCVGVHLYVKASA